MVGHADKGAVLARKRRLVKRMRIGKAGHGGFFFKGPVGGGALQVGQVAEGFRLEMVQRW